MIDAQFAHEEGLYLSMFDGYFAHAECVKGG